MKGRHNLTIFLDNFSTNFRRNSTRKIERWFEELIDLNHLAIFITAFHQKLVEKLSKKIQLSLSHYLTLTTLWKWKNRLSTYLYQLRPSFRSQSKEKKKNIVALLKQHNRKLYEKIEKWFRRKAFLRVKKTGRYRKAVSYRRLKIYLSRDATASLNRHCVFCL